jgi:hypothetical protein
MDATNARSILETITELPTAIVVTTLSHVSGYRANFDTIVFAGVDIDDDKAAHLQARGRSNLPVVTLLYVNCRNVPERS